VNPSSFEFAMAGETHDWYLGPNRKSTGSEMTSDLEKAVEQLLDTPELATALESDQFKKFLDQMPIAIAVSELSGKERVVYANPEFERLSGLKAVALTRQNCAALPGIGLYQHKGRALGSAVVEETDFVGTFRLEREADNSAIVDVYSNVIVDDNGTSCFRLVALVNVSSHGAHEDGRQSRSAFARMTRCCANFSTGSRITFK
jgi:PAS domain-containing protein